MAYDGCVWEEPSDHDSEHSAMKLLLYLLSIQAL